MSGVLTARFASVWLLGGKHFMISCISSNDGLETCPEGTGVLCLTMRHIWKEAAYEYQERELRTGTKEVVNVKLCKSVQSHIIVVARVDFVHDVRPTFFGGCMDDNVTEQSCTYYCRRTCPVRWGGTCLERSTGFIGLMGRRSRVVRIVGQRYWHGRRF